MALKTYRPTTPSLRQLVQVDRSGLWKGDPLKILTEGDRRLFNQYGVMLVNPAKHPTVKAADGQAFVDWLISPAGQKAIADYKVGGEQLFFPNAGTS